MIERAKKRCQGYEERINFSVLDATDYNSMVSLGKGRFDKAVANMALMDIAQLDPLFKAVCDLLKTGGVFVFSLIHPCFQAPGLKKVYEEEEIGNKTITRRSIQISRYIKSETFEGLSIRNQPIATRYFHRPLSDLLTSGFENGFVLNGIAEPTFSEDKLNENKFDWIDIPPALIGRFKKI